MVNEYIAWPFQYNNIFLSMLETEEILYFPDKNRNCILILRLYLRTFVFSMIIKIHLQGKSKTLTKWKFFGTYYHYLNRHTAEQYGLFPGTSTNTEKEEATFNKIKVYTNLSSNHYLENLILNAVIWLQVNEEFRQKSFSKKNDLSYTYPPIKETFSNAMIPFAWIKNVHFNIIVCWRGELITYLVRRYGGTKTLME